MHLSMGHCFSYNTNCILPSLPISAGVGRRLHCTHYHASYTEKSTKLNFLSEAVTHKDAKCLLPVVRFHVVVVVIGNCNWV